MSSIGNLLIADAVPSNHTFYPIQSGLSSSWITHEGANALVQSKIITSLSLASATRKTDKGKVALYVPYPVTVDGAVVARDTSRFICDVIMADGSSETERGNFWAMVLSTLATAAIKNTFIQRDPTL